MIACSSRCIVKVLIWAMLVSLHLFLSAVGDGGGGAHQSSEKQGPNLAERAIGFTSTSKTWDKIRSWLHLFWMNGRSLHMESSKKFPSNAGNAMKEAVSQSIHSSKSTAENAARMVDEVVHKSAEKLKRTAPNSHSRRDDSDKEL